MGTMKFALPDELSPQTARELGRACVVGGPDAMPWPTRTDVEGACLIVRRDVEESGNLLVPWCVDGVGHFMLASATLMEREPPYDLLLELARGKVNQLRSQASDWQEGGVQLPPELTDQIRQVSCQLARALTQESAKEASQLAATVLAETCHAAESLVRVYVDQVFRFRHQRTPLLDSDLACGLNRLPNPDGVASAVQTAFNAISVPMTWKQVEPAESQFNWRATDEIVAWAEDQGLRVSAGPLIDLAPDQLPDWLGLWERDLHGLADFMCHYVEAAVRRYRGRIRYWQLTAASNWTSALSLGEDELLWINVRVAEAARHVDPSLEVVVGICQPWGDYMAREDRNQSPFLFADTLIRAGLNLAALDLEWVMAVEPRGSYCRDLLEASRLLDLYALLGVPLQVTLGYPSAAGPDPGSAQGCQVAAGRWRGGFTPGDQADWTEAMAALALCKPFVRGVRWVHLDDAGPHWAPHCGLIDGSGEVRPGLERLRQLRQLHLR
ncbi:MAG: endo-1,4-beta-xylanase [Gemmataceae bacterium]|nr:endo-1,4-beta-xylanase [Gemmataceae bacterium]MDW8265907.1 endo-1,4-beta-xylanase [Gemmataceae bacterium]